MPIYKISKDDRCKLFNLSPDLYDQAQRLIAERDNEIESALAEQRRLDAAGVPQQEWPQVPSFLSWYDACRAIDPNVNFGRWHFFVDCASGDQGGHLTIALPEISATMLQRELGIELEYVHKVHHRPQDHPE
ncbi:hypothetical protein [Bradyrhizobium sp. HKCCYLR20261]|uniref:hypothetical protein n=1 Tax=Bradyrhizobium sp. HKCCYLR20261 TaxID=3420760 RepID=UPI003EBDBEE3